MLQRIDFPEEKRSVKEDLHTLSKLEVHNRGLYSAWHLHCSEMGKYEAVLPSEHYPTSQLCQLQIYHGTENAAD